MKNIKNMEGVQNFSFPFVIVRKKLERDKILEMVSDDNNIIFYLTILFSLIFVVMEIFTMSLFFVYLLFSFWVFFGFLKFCQKHNAKRIFDKYEKIPEVSPFIILDKDKISIYDTYGDLIKSFSIKHIKQIRHWHKSSVGSGVSWNGFEILFMDNIFDKFVFNKTAQFGYFSTFYIEYQGVQYRIDDDYWFMSNILDMLKKDPNAEHFPFRRKNYINGRKWDEP